jgi:uncharacterized membrane protein
MLRAKNVVFAFVGVMTAYVLYHNERFLIEPDNPIWQHFQPFKWWLLAHGVAGGCALLLAPMQFSDRLRRRFTRTHRIVGRIYVAGVLMLAPTGAYIQYFQERDGLPRSFTVLAGVDAALLLATTGIGLLFALTRNIQQHRQWMTRSYAVALVFFEGRFILGVTGWETAGVAVSEMVIWACLAFAVLFGDVANNWHELRAAVSPAKRGRLAPGRKPVYQTSGV